MKLCHQFKELETPWGPIKLEQNGRNDFRVTYGKEVHDGLTYSQAARKLGEAQMHFLACLGKLDNRLSWGDMD